MFTIMLNVRKHNETTFRCVPLGTKPTVADCKLELELGGMASFQGSEVTATLCPHDMREKCVKFAVQGGQWVQI